MEIPPPGPLVEPPPGVTSNFDAPNHNGVALWVVSLILLIVSTLFLAARIYTRAVLIRTLGWDDYTCVVAWLATVFTTVMVKIVTDLGVGKHGWDVYIVDFLAFTAREAKARFALQFTYLWIMGLVKVSILLMYLRIFNTTRWFRLIVYGTMFVVVGVHFGCIVGYLCQNRPISAYWDPVRDEATEWVSMDNPIIALAVITIITDVIVLILPIPITWRLHMRMRQKLIVMGILLVGVIVTLASVWRLVTLVQLIFYGEIDWTYTEYRFFFATSFEVNLAIMCACAPVLQAFVKKFAPRMLRLQTSQPSYGAEASAGGDRTRPRRDSRTTSKVRPKWPQENQSQDGDLANLTYVELSERGKSDEYSNSNRAVAEP